MSSHCIKRGLRFNRGISSNLYKEKHWPPLPELERLGPESVLNEEHRVGFLVSRSPEPYHCLVHTTAAMLRNAISSIVKFYESFLQVWETRPRSSQRT